MMYAWCPETPVMELLRFPCAATSFLRTGTSESPFLEFLRTACARNLVPYKAQICNVEALICHFYKNIKLSRKFISLETHYISYMHYFEPVSFSTKSYRSSVRRTLRFKSDSPTDAKFYVSVS